MHPEIQKKSRNYDMLLKRKFAASRLNDVQKILLSGNSDSYQENLIKKFIILSNEFKKYCFQGIQTIIRKTLSRSLSSYHLTSQFCGTEKSLSCLRILCADNRNNLTVQQCPELWFQNLSRHQNHMEVLKHGLLGLLPESDSVSRGWSLIIRIF